MVEKRVVTERILVRALAKQLKLRVVTFAGVSIPEEILKTIPKELAVSRNVIPFQIQGNFLDVALNDPLDTGIIDELRIRTQLNVRPHLAPTSEIKAAILDGYHAGIAPNAIAVDFGTPSTDDLIRTPKDSKSELRDAEVAALQRRLQTLEGLVTRDEQVIRKLLTLLIDKGIATREEMLEAIR